MFLSCVPRALPAYRRSFVSTVLLSRTWENETVVELRKEAKTRGLSTKGNKSTLITRIQEHEKNSNAPVHTPGTVRSASTDAVPPVSPKKTSQAVSPGIPLPERTFIIPDSLGIKLPDPSRPSYSAPVQIPYVPDFWNSARLKADPLSEPELPKLHVVGGSVTPYDGGPTHNLEKSLEGDSLSVHANDPPVFKEFGIWADLWESCGLPRSFSVRRALSEARDLASKAGEDGPRSHSRPLSDDEKRGLYVLLGIIGSSWLVGGLTNRQTAVTEEHETT